MTLIQSFSHDYHRWSRAEQIISKMAVVMATVGMAAATITPLLG